MQIKCRYSKTINSFKKISDTFALYTSRDLTKMPEKIACTKNKAGVVTIRVIGKNLPRISDWEIVFIGDFKSLKNGYTFFAESYELVKPDNRKGIIRYLSSKNFKGVGSTTAKAIVDVFGVDTLEVIEKNPEKLYEVQNLNKQKIETIIACYNKNLSFSKLASYLTEYGVSASIIEKVYREYGDKSLSLIKNNPYILLRIDSLGFKTAEKIALKENVSLDSYQRCKGAMNSVLKQTCDRTGDMLVLYPEFESSTLELLNHGLNPKPVSLELFRKYVIKASNEGDIVCRSKKYVFLAKYDRAEERSALLLSRFLSKPVTLKEYDAIINSFNDKSLIKLSALQLEAVKKSLTSRVSIITGGPGTGKTTILKAIINCWLEKNGYNKNVILLAPTGKAARRMSESTGFPASTIHSKLRLYEDSVNPCPIESGLVIVDESSMLDNLLFEKLLSALNIDSQVIFVGDINQLPSVGSGAVLGQLISSNVVPTSKLQEVFRQKNGGSIVDNASMINNGIDNLEYDDSFKFVEARNEKDAVNIIKEIYTKEVEERGIDNVALLSPLRKTQNGKFMCVSESLNSELQEMANTSKLKSVTIKGTTYYLHDRILQWKNTEKSSNGDIGEIVGIGENDDGIAVDIKWDNGNETTESKETMSNITLAYSISIHKSQGSEYESVIIPMLSNQKCALFKRNLLYTGITRGKKKVIIVGDKKAISECISKSDTNIRKTLLAQRIRNQVENLALH